MIVGLQITYMHAIKFLLKKFEFKLLLFPKGFTNFYNTPCANFSEFS